MALVMKVINKVKSFNFFAFGLLLCQVAILLMSTCTIYKKQLQNRFAIGTGLYETKVRVQYHDFAVCTIILILHVLSHLTSRVGHLSSLPYSLFLSKALLSRYVPFVQQCFSILRNDPHLKHIIYFKLTTVLYVVFGLVQSFVVVSVLWRVYGEWKPQLSNMKERKAIKESNERELK